MVHGALLGALGEGTPGGVIGDAISCINVGVAGAVMLGGLISTPLVRLPSSGQRVGASWVTTYLVLAKKGISS